ncbi:MAG: VPLPA-CTERM sorting domain-containing protein [Pseudomonadota bacterium]
MTSNLTQKLRVGAAAAIMSMALCAASAASAAVYNFSLGDNPDGTETSKGYDYGLRLDYYGKFFSFDNGSDATLSYDSTNGVASITGTMRESLGYNADKTERLYGDLWTVSYVMTGLTDLGGGAFEDTVGNGSGTITLGDMSLSLGAKSDGSTYFTLDDDGYRLPKGSDLFSGRGWVDPKPGLRGANDFLFTAEIAIMPVPAAGWLLIAGLGGLGALRRRQRKTA